MDSSELVFETEKLRVLLLIEGLPDLVLDLVDTGRDVVLQEFPGIIQLVLKVLGPGAVDLASLILDGGMNCLEQGDTGPDLVPESVPPYFGAAGEIGDRGRLGGEGGRSHGEPSRGVPHYQCVVSGVRRIGATSSGRGGSSFHASIKLHLSDEVWLEIGCL